MVPDNFNFRGPKGLVLGWPWLVKCNKDWYDNFCKRLNVYQWFWSSTVCWSSAAEHAGKKLIEFEPELLHQQVQQLYMIEIISLHL